MAILELKATIAALAGEMAQRISSRWQAAEATMVMVPIVLMSASDGGTGTGGPGHGAPARWGQ